MSFKRCTVDKSSDEFIDSTNILKESLVEILTKTDDYRFKYMNMAKLNIEKENDIDMSISALLDKMIDKNSHKKKFKRIKRETNKDESTDVNNNNSSNYKANDELSDSLLDSSIDYSYSPPLIIPKSYSLMSDFDIIFNTLNFNIFDNMNVDDTNTNTNYELDLSSQELLADIDIGLVNRLNNNNIINENDLKTMEHTYMDTYTSNNSNSDDDFELLANAAILNSENNLKPIEHHHTSNTSNSDEDFHLLAR